MDGFIFTFLPIAAEASLPVLALALFLPRLQSLMIARAATRLRAKRQDDYVRGLEAYVTEAHQLICDLILDANSTTSPVHLPEAREHALYELQRHLPSSLKELHRA